MVSKPHGGKLVDGVLSKEDTIRIVKNLAEYKSLVLNQSLIMDVEKIAIGSFSPLEGFMNEEDYFSVLKNKRLKSDFIWPIPIVLPLNENEAKSFNELEEIILRDENNNPIALFRIEEKYLRDLKEEAMMVYGTQDQQHPGVKQIYSEGKVLFGGKISLIQRTRNFFSSYELTPSETRKIFDDRNWNSIAAFHTRNVPHRAHEFIQKLSLELVDGLFIHPVIGKKKKGDFKAETIIRTYEELINNFYQKSRVLFSTLSTYSRYAGPREAIFTALVRKNYGATHFIIGRDHTGVKDFYKKFDSHKMFSEFEGNELGIVPLMFSEAYFCNGCDGMTTQKSCPHDINEHIRISGTKIRELILNGERIPDEVIRPEIARLLNKNSFV